MRFGVTEHRQDEGGLFKGAGGALAEGVASVAITVIFGPVVAFLVGLALWKMWPTWDEVLGFAILIGVFVLGVLWLVVALRGHWAGSEAKTNQAKVIHATDQGVTYAHKGGVWGHSHGTDLSPINGTDGEARDDFGGEDDFGPPNTYTQGGRKPPKTYRDMVRMGFSGPDQDIVLAFEDSGSPISMPNFTSLGIGGVQGSGKTVTTLVIMLQAIAKYNGRVKFLIVDPHLHVSGIREESLSSRIAELSPFFLRVDGMANPTVGTAELPGWMDYIKQEQDRRMGGGEWKDVWLLVMDEFVSTMNTEWGLAVLPVLEAINREARKIEMFALLVSQEWLASRIGGTELRHAIASFALHNMPESVATLIVPSDVARMAPKMRVGQILSHSLGKTRVGRVVLADAIDSKNAVIRYGPRSPIGEAGQDVYPRMGDIPPFPVPDLIKRARVPAGFDPEVVESVRQGVREGLSQSDIADSAFGNHGTYSVNQVREILKGLVS